MGAERLLGVSKDPWTLIRVGVCARGVTGRLAERGGGRGGRGRNQLLHPMRHIPLSDLRRGRDERLGRIRYEGHTRCVIVRRGEQPRPRVWSGAEELGSGGRGRRGEQPRPRVWSGAEELGSGGRGRRGERCEVWCTLPTEEL